MTAAPAIIGVESCAIAREDRACRTTPRARPALEHDLLGERAGSRGRVLGHPHAARGRELPDHGRAIGLWPELIRALALVKHAAAQTNYELGLLDETKAKLIIAACREIASGALHDQFVVDQIQGGAGTSTNMNANEVIANRALELGGRQKGDYAYLHPIEHVNVAQSTNDVYPTALEARRALRDRRPDRGDGGAEAGVRGEVRGVPRPPEGRPHAAPGRGADDARARSSRPSPSCSARTSSGCTRPAR